MKGLDTNHLPVLCCLVSTDSDSDESELIQTVHCPLQYPIVSQNFATSKQNTRAQQAERPTSSPRALPRSPPSCGSPTTARSCSCCSSSSSRSSRSAQQTTRGCRGYVHSHISRDEQDLSPASCHAASAHACDSLCDGNVTRTGDARGLSRHDPAHGPALPRRVAVPVQSRLQGALLRSYTLVSVAHCSPPASLTPRAELGAICGSKVLARSSLAL